MKRFVLCILAAACLSGFSSCKKFIDQQKENYLLKLMTDGHWYLQTYSMAGVDSTFLFSGYEFQFYKNETVDALYGPTATNGTWKGDLTNLTFTSRFPTASEPLYRLNQVWKVTDSYTDAVFAEVTTPTGQATILLRKK